MDYSETQYVIAIIPPERVSRALEALFAFDVIEPHITVKAQPGLDAETKEEWLRSIRTAVTGFGPVDVHLGSAAAFSNDVIYLKIEGNRLLQLHHILMETVVPDEGEAARYFELEDWTPHLTLIVGQDHDVAAADKARASLLEHDLRVGSLWVFRQDKPGSRYVRDSEIVLD